MGRKLKLKKKWSGEEYQVHTPRCNHFLLSFECDRVAGWDERPEEAGGGGGGSEGEGLSRRGGEEETRGNKGLFKKQRRHTNTFL